MGEEKKPKKRAFRRLPPAVGVGLRKLKRELDDLREEFTEWAKDRCEELKLYVDQVNFETGAVLDPILGDKIVRRLKLEGREKEILDEARKKQKEIQDASKAFHRRSQDIGAEYGLPAKSLNVDTGEIVEDIVVVTAKTLEEQEKEAEEKAKEKDDKISKLFQDEDSAEKEE